MAAGYSGTPLLKKLGVKDGQTALLVAIPEDFTALNGFENWRRLKLAKTERGITGGPYDYIHYFADSEKALISAMPKLRKALKQDGMVWVSWPKKASGIKTTVTGDLVRTLALTNGLVDIKVCAVDDTWSVLKLVIPVKDRKND